MPGETPGPGPPDGTAAGKGAAVGADTAQQAAKKKETFPMEKENMKNLPFSTGKENASPPGEKKQALSKAWRESS